MFSRFFIFLILCLSLSGIIRGQSNGNVTQKSNTWIGLITQFKWKKHGLLLVDFHHRRDEFLSNSNFYIIRMGIGRSFGHQHSLVAGYGHMWVAANSGGRQFFTGENRLYEQWQHLSKWGKTGFLQRIRNEQRWHQTVANGQKSAYNRFSNRFRYMVQWNIPVFKNPHLPSLVVAEEAMWQVGKHIAHNQFDQNRFYLGLRQSMNTHLQFDLGYMNLHQQKSDGIHWDNNHVLRLFIFYQH